MSVLFFIGAVVPPSLIVLISLCSIPGYLALSGLFYNGLFFKAKPVHAMALIMHFAALNSITDPAI